MYVHLARQLYALLIVRTTTAIRTTTRLQRVANGLMVLALLAALSLALLIGFGSYYVSTTLLETLPPIGHLLILDAMVVAAAVFWLWSLILDVQRNDTFDVRTILTLPVTPWLVVLLNYLLSLVSFIMFLFPPALVGYVLGLHTRYDAPLLGVLTPVFFFVLAMAGWVYYLRGLISAHMENKRRRAILLTVLPITFVLLSQMPLLVMNLIGENMDSYVHQILTSPQMRGALLGFNVIFPPAWMPYAIYAAKEGLWIQSMLACAGVAGLWVLSLRLAYGATLRYYRGETAAGSGRRGSNAPRRYITLRHLPGLDDVTAGLAWATFLNMARHPQVRMMLIMPLVLALIVLASATMQQERLNDSLPRLGAETGLVSPDFPVSTILFIFLPFINLAMVMFNQFGFDSNGFRGLLLLPVEKRKILLARNVSFIPFLIMLSLAFVLPAVWIMGLSPDHTAIALLQTAQLFLLFCMAGNYLSILSPYRVGRNSMKGTGNRAMMMLLGLLALPLVIVLAVPSLLCLTIDNLLMPYAMLKHVPVGLVLSLAFLAMTTPAYLVSLRHAAKIFARREQRMLATLVRDTG